ncbi:MAG: hypothetical protein KDD04_02880, partial [Sinomicrobium sp.]|nr:hypothetical protein [Sinomicrobium sp.]
MVKVNYRKYFLTALIVALSVSALIGILVFLLGDFGETEMRILMTTLTIGGFSLTGLSSAVIYHRDRLRVFSVAG